MQKLYTVNTTGSWARIGSWSLDPDHRVTIITTSVAGQVAQQIVVDDANGHVASAIAQFEQEFLGEVTEIEFPPRVGY